MVRASARKKVPVTPVTEIRGRKTTIGVMVETTSGVAISAGQCGRRFDARLARVAMEGDVFDHHDGVIDDQADGGGESAEGHQVEALADGPEKENVTAMVTGMTRPATSEEDQSRRKRTMMMQARMSPMRMASRTLAMVSRTKSDWS